MRAFPRFQVFALSAALLGSGGGSIPLLAAPPTAIEVARQLNEAFVDVAQRGTASVVVVQVSQKLETLAGKSDHPFLKQMPEEMREQFEEHLRKERERQEREGPSFNGEGSGIIYREDGFILTNAHVVENADRIRVKLHDGREVEAEVRGQDPESDIAILKLKESVSGLRPARFGNSDGVRVGEFAIAIGAPYELEYSVTFGHISAKGRAGLSKLLMDEDFLQTDANINPGNSGGPLLNLEGEVIGVNSMIRGVGTGICFAIPANLAREVADQLVDTGRFQRSWLAVGILGIREDERLRALYPDMTNGVFVTQVPASGPARRADLRREDIITAIDGRSVASVNQLRRLITRRRPGSEIQIEFLRDGKPLTAKLTTDAMPELAERNGLFDPRVPRGPRRPDPEAEAEAEPGAEYGLVVRAPDQELTEKYKLGKTAGVVVTSVDADSQLAEYGFQVGDLIFEVDKKPVKTSAQFAEILKDATAKKKFTVRYQRSGEKLSAVVLNESGSAKEKPKR